MCPWRESMYMIKNKERIRIAALYGSFSNCLHLNCIACNSTKVNKEKGFEMCDDGEREPVHDQIRIVQFIR